MSATERGSMYFTLGTIFDLRPQTTRVNGRRIPPKPHAIYPGAGYFPLLTPEEWRDLDCHDPMHPLHITGEPKGFSLSQLTEVVAELCHMTTEGIAELCNMANPPGTAEQGREDPSMGLDNNVQARIESFRCFEGKQRGIVYLECNGRLGALIVGERTGATYHTLSTMFDLRADSIKVNGRRVPPQDDGMYYGDGSFLLLTPEEA